MPLPLIPLAVELVALATTGIAAWFGVENIKKDNQLKKAGIVEDRPSMLKKALNYIAVGGFFFAVYKFIKLFKK